MTNPVLPISPEQEASSSWLEKVASNKMARHLEDIEVKTLLGGEMIECLPLTRDITMQRTVNLAGYDPIEVKYDAGNRLGYRWQTATTLPNGEVVVTDKNNSYTASATALDGFRRLRLTWNILRAKPDHFFMDAAFFGKIEEL
jgi:hypothetical protein